MIQNTKKFQVAILPIMLGFFIMGFVDIIGVSVNYINADYKSLSAGFINLLTSSCFIWFFLLSVPTGMLMNRIGRKNTVLISFLVQVLAFLLVFTNYGFLSLIISFSLLGIGNTILQVALNPLVTNVVSSEKQTGTLTIGQLVKAICSMTGPILVGWFAGSMLGWKFIFPVYALISLAGFIWLVLTPVKKEQKSEVVENSMKSIFSLFADKYILAFFVAILVLVGVDVGVNVTFPKYLQQTCDLSLTESALGNSVYFFSRTVGALLGGILLMKMRETKFYNVSIVIAVIGLLGLIFVHSHFFALVFVSIFGLGYSNLFAIVVSMAMKHKPERSNDISALMIMGVAGGGVLPPLMGVITDFTGNQWSAILVLAVVWLYMFTLMGKIKRINSYVK